MTLVFARLSAWHVACTSVDPMSSIKIAVVCALAVVTCSCGERLVPAEAGSFRSARLIEAAKKVLILQNQDAGSPTEVLGVIDVHQETGGQDAALETLRERAALYGADAVLGVEFHHEGDGHAKDTETHLSGLAVKFRPVLANRPYRVLGPVQVDAEMGHESEGLHDLRAKAGDMNADVLVDVQFHHGEGGAEKTRLTGLAIKYL
jgi:uncharacterized protein YbjQ (UPF0145 family)